MVVLRVWFSPAFSFFPEEAIFINWIPTGLYFSGMHRDIFSYVLFTDLRSRCLYEGNVGGLGGMDRWEGNYEPTCAYVQYAFVFSLRALLNVYLCFWTPFENEMIHLKYSSITLIIPKSATHSSAFSFIAPGICIVFP